MAKTSLAAVFHETGQPLTFQRYELPTPGPGEVLVRITCSTLCGSDVHTFLGRRSTPVPTVLGHEIMGVVESLAADQAVSDCAGQPLQVGDRITWSIAASCDDCFFCDNDVPQKCEHLFKYGHEKIVPEHPLSGGLADYCHLAAGTAIFRVPDSLSDVVACPANCATATVAGAIRVGGGCERKSVLIQGAGMLGLTATAMARTYGAQKVIVCDVDADRLRRAAQFGATQTLLVSEDEHELIASVQDLTDGRGVDLAVELSGAASAVQTGVKLPRIGGRYVLIGSTFPIPPVGLDPESVVRRCLTIVGNHNYRPEDLGAAVSFLVEHGGEFPFADLVHDGFSLPDAEAAFARAVKGQDLRVAVRPET
jgi:alcohol dehydrogenase